MKISQHALFSILIFGSTATFSKAFSRQCAFRTNFPGIHGKILAKPLALTTGARLDRNAPSKKGVNRKMTETDEDGLEDDGPLGQGIDSVAWLPSVTGGKSSDVSSVRDGADILPLFPLGGIVYTPNSEHVLNIFEPRYRQMYTDILMNGTKRFVVAMSHPTESGRFAQTGVLFELEDLKEVSEQTEDQIKYICNHKVTGRVKLHRVLNPEAWESRDTYLKVEGTITDDTKEVAEDDSSSDKANDIYRAVAEAAGKSLSKEEKSLRDAFAQLVEIQHELKEDVRFTRASVGDLALKPGAGSDGLWQTIRLWQSYAEQRLVSRQNDLQRDFQEKLAEFLTKEKGLKDEELPSAIGFQELSPALQQEIQELQKRMAVEMKPLLLEQTLTMQKILEAEDHAERCNLLRYFVDAEKKRLNTKKSLQSMFAAGPSTASEKDMEAIPPEEMINDTDSGDAKPVESKPGSLFTDEPDSFQ